MSYTQGPNTALRTHQIRAVKWITERERISTIALRAHNDNVPIDVKVPTGDGCAAAVTLERKRGIVCGGILGSDPGTGKTLTWMKVIAEDRQRLEADPTVTVPIAPTLVVCGKTVMSVWKCQFDEHWPSARVVYVHMDMHADVCKWQYSDTSWEHPNRGALCGDIDVVVVTFHRLRDAYTDCVLSWIKDVIERDTAQRRGVKTYREFERTQAHKQAAQEDAQQGRNYAQELHEAGTGVTLAKIPSTPDSDSSTAVSRTESALSIVPDAETTMIRGYARWKTDAYKLHPRNTRHYFPKVPFSPDVDGADNLAPMLSWATPQQLNNTRCRGVAFLYHTRWRRVIVDEFHEARNMASQLTMALMRIDAEWRWVSTGTLIQNDVNKEIYTSFAFLRHPALPRMFSASPDRVSTSPWSKDLRCCWKLFNAMIKGLPEGETDYEWFVTDAINNVEWSDVYRPLRAVAVTETGMLTDRDSGTAVSGVERELVPSTRQAIIKYVGRRNGRMPQCFSVMDSFFRQLLRLMHRDSIHHLIGVGGNRDTHGVNNTTTVIRSSLKRTRSKGKGTASVVQIEVGKKPRVSNNDELATSAVAMVKNDNENGINIGGKLKRHVLAWPFQTRDEAALYLDLRQSLSKLVDAKNKNKNKNKRGDNRHNDNAFQVHNLELESIESSTVNGDGAISRLMSDKKLKSQTILSLLVVARQTAIVPGIVRMGGMPVVESSDPMSWIWGGSTKMRMLRTELERWAEEERETGNGIVIFSQFVKALNAVDKYILGPMGLNACRITGENSKIKDREHEVSVFQDRNQNRRRVFLISAQSGSTGITLTRATRGIMLDPWWNPQLEKQCVMRLYRDGQENDVIFTYFTIRGTIEEYVYENAREKEREINKVMEEHDRMQQISRQGLYVTGNMSSPAAVKAEDKCIKTCNRLRTSFSPTDYEWLSRTFFQSSYDIQQSDTASESTTVVYRCTDIGTLMGLARIDTEMDERNQQDSIMKNVKSALEAATATTTVVPASVTPFSLSYATLKMPNGPGMASNATFGATLASKSPLHRRYGKKNLQGCLYAVRIVQPRAQVQPPAFFANRTTTSDKPIAVRPLRMHTIGSFRDLIVAPSPNDISKSTDRNHKEIHHNTPPLVPIHNGRLFQNSSKAKEYAHRVAEAIKQTYPRALVAAASCIVATGAFKGSTFTEPTCEGHTSEGANITHFQRAVRNAMGDKKDNNNDNNTRNNTVTLLVQVVRIIFDQPIPYPALRIVDCRLQTQGATLEQRHRSLANVFGLLLPTSITNMPSQSLIAHLDTLRAAIVGDSTGALDIDQPLSNDIGTALYHFFLNPNVFGRHSDAYRHETYMNDPAIVPLQKCYGSALATPSFVRVQGPMTSTSTANMRNNNNNNNKKKKNSSDDKGLKSATARPSLYFRCHGWSLDDDSFVLFDWPSNKWPTVRSQTYESINVDIAGTNLLVF